MTGYRDVIAALAAKPYARDLFGIVLGEVSAGAVSLTIEHRADLGHRPGWFQGAVTSAIGELAASWSTITLCPDAVTMTIEQSIRFIAPAKGERLVAIGRVISSGRSISMAAADIFVEADGDRTPCAMLTLTNHHRQPR